MVGKRSLRKKMYIVSGCLLFKIKRQMGKHTSLAGHNRHFFRQFAFRNLSIMKNMAKDNCRMVMIKRGMEVN